MLLSSTACFLSILFQNDFLSNIFLPLNAFIAGAFLLLCSIKTATNHLQKINCLLYTVACFAWGIGDCLWAILDIFLADPATNLLLNSIYLLTNLCLACALFVFSRKQLTKWNNVQLYLDAFIIGLMSFIFIWFSFLDKDSSIVNRMLDYDVTSLLSIALDFVLAIALISMFLSVRSGKIARFLKLIALGLFVFCFTDILYYYTDIHNIYLPNSWIDFVYILALHLICLGILCRHFVPEETKHPIQLTNIGMNHKWMFMLLYPCLAFLLDVLNLIKAKVALADFVMFFVLIFVHRAASKYVQKSIRNEQLLEREKLANELLEQRVSEQVAELTFLANQDTLTTLWNRRHFLTCIDESIQSLRASETLALMLLDIDRFKMINDDFGHDVGDLVLIALSQRMLVWNNYGAVLARLGGDEFAVLFVGKYTKSELQEYGLQFIQACNEPIEVDGRTLSMTVSVGVSLHSPEICDSKLLLQHADISLYMAKSQGYNKLQFYDSIFSEDFSRNRKIESLLKQSDLEQDFELFFQPQFSLPDKKLTGAEALIRWNHPEHGYIPPSLFIPIAEEIDKIFKIGSWVMQESITQAMIWNKNYQIDLMVGFNISSKQLDDDGFIYSLKSLILDTGVNTAWLDAEITESIMITEGEKIESIFQALRKLGLSISIDDFGSGYSALSYLNKYHFDKIKIDKSLIDHVSSDNKSGIHVVAAVISMAKAVGVKTLAEGVETQEQLDILMELGCDAVQGYLLGRPVPADVFEQRFLCGMPAL